MNKGGKKPGVQGVKTVKKLGNRKRVWGNSEYKGMNNLEGIKSSANSKDWCRGLGSRIQGDI